MNIELLDITVDIYKLETTWCQHMLVFPASRRHSSTRIQKFNRPVIEIPPHNVSV